MGGSRIEKGENMRIERKWRCLFGLLAAFVLMALPMWSMAQNDIWTHVPGADRLKAAHKDVLTQVFAKANCYAGCPDTLANCLKDAPEEPAVKRLAGFAVRRALKGGTVESILEDIKHRAVSVYPPITYKPTSKDSPLREIPRPRFRS